MGNATVRSSRRLGRVLTAAAWETPKPADQGLAAALSDIRRSLHARGVLLTIGAASDLCILAKAGTAPSVNPSRADRSWRCFPLAEQHVEYGCLWITAGSWEADPALGKQLEPARYLLTSTLRSYHALQSERDQRALAETLQHVSEVLTSTLDIEQVLARILDELARLVPYDSATVMLLEEGVLHLHAERGFKRVGAKPGHDVVTFIPDETAFATEVLAGDHPILVADAKSVPGWIWVPGSSHIRSWMGVPLRVHDQAIGMFSIDKSQPDYFTPRHAELAAAVAPHAAIAIENARLFRDLRSAESQLRTLTLHVIDVQESERQSIARELHDHAGQALLALRAELQILERQIPPESTAAHGQLGKMDEILRETARDLRLLSHELRSHLLDELGLASALQQQARDFTERFAVKVELVVQGDAARRRPRAVELAAFRLVQEALTNVARHAQAKTVWIRLSDLPGKLQLVVEDDGEGFDVDTILRQGTVGLIGMRERVAAVNGTLHLRSRRDEGTQITAEFPEAGAAAQPETNDHAG